MTASLIIPTFNRSVLLGMMLEHVAQLPDENLYEVIVCDDGSSDDTEAVCRSFAERVPLRYYRQENRGFRAAAARNIGIAAAEGDVLIFLDDDCLPLPGFINAHCEAHNTSRPVVGIGLRSRLNSGVSGKLATDPEVDERTGLIREGTFADPAPWKLVYSCNLSLGRKHSETYFDESFIGWGMEDTDLGYRLWRAGVDYRVVTAAEVMHVDDDLPRDPFRCEAQQLPPDYESYLRNCERLLAKFPHDEDLWDGLLPDLRWYSYDLSNRRWFKDGNQHDPMTIVRALAESSAEQERNSSIDLSGRDRHQ